MRKPKKLKTLFLPILAAFVLLLVLAPVCTASGYAPLTMSEKERAAASLFLSNFTEIGLDACSVDSDDMTLVDFAHDHLWFNDHDAYEYGEYDADYNCRVSDDRIQSVINQYFYEPHDADITQTRFNYKNGYYYHCETGGWINAGFAHAVSLCPLGEDRYFVSCLIYGGGDVWTADTIALTQDEIEAIYGAPLGCCSAVVHTTDLSDRSAYRLISFSRLPL